MYPPLDACFHTSHQLLFPALYLRLLTRHPQDTLRHESGPGFTHPDRPDPWMLVQCDQTAAHYGTVGGPWGPPVV